MGPCFEGGLSAVVKDCQYTSGKSGFGSPSGAKE